MGSKNWFGDLLEMESQRRLEVGIHAQTHGWGFTWFLVVRSGQILWKLKSIDLID